MSIESTELELFLVNDAGLYFSYTLPTYKNLQKHFKSGNYDPKLALRSFLRVSSMASKAYDKEFGYSFDYEARKEVAEHLEAAFRAECELGNFYD